jgi:hypothetical protein
MLVGSSFEVDLPHAGRIEAVIVWNSGEFYGCQFELPITPATLSAALLQGESAAPGKSRPAGDDPMSELRELTVEIERLAFQMESALRRLNLK